MERLFKKIFFCTAIVSVIAVALICIFMFASGVPAMAKIGFGEFLFGKIWQPEADTFGIFAMILASIAVTLGAIVLGVPLGILSAVFLARFCPKNFYGVLKNAVNLLAGIPSVVYGFVTLNTVVPAIRFIAGGSGASIAAAMIVLAVMILPTIISVSESAILAVPPSYFEGSLALGACKERSVFFAELPAAKSGIIAGVILGLGRAIGETMAVIMVCGNQALVPRGLFKGARTLTGNIVLEMGYAEGLHRDALIATSVVLFVFILIINAAFIAVKNKNSE